MCKREGLDFKEMGNASGARFSQATCWQMSYAGTSLLGSRLSSKIHLVIGPDPSCRHIVDRQTDRHSHQGSVRIYTTTQKRPRYFHRLRLIVFFGALSQGLPQLKLELAILSTTGCLLGSEFWLNHFAWITFDVRMSNDNLSLKKA